ncbi:MAG: OmcA/MtrC family decaheme c-type cytochrome [Burkholderiales bacterium]|nr:OmcA/MtrC family decaheme c-type cytochrome [Burkholderiales bacterium]
MANLTAAQVAALTPAISVGSVVIASPPVVTFAVSDGATTNNAIIGMGKATQSGTTLPRLDYLRFGLAKLVPGTSGAPSKWVNYVVKTAPTYTSATDKTLVDGVAQRPNVEREGTLVDNGNGTYTYTFITDITKVKDDLAAATGAADLGDLTYDPTLTHRLTIQLSGGDFANPVNAIYDFIPATGQAVAATDTQRQVVSIDSCNQCHEKLAFHGSARIDTQYCVVCHTDQRKFGRDVVKSTSLAFPALKETATVSSTTGITSYSYSPSTYVGDTETMGNFTTLIHKIHNGAELKKTGYNYANVAFNNKGFSMLGGGQKMCSVCHDSTKAAQADNYGAVPSRLACGACHDGINFADGSGTTIGGKTTGHVGKSQSSDAVCALCHAAADIKVYHQTENKTEHNPTVATGLANFTYEIKSAAVNSSNVLSVVFKISKDGTALTALPPTGFTGSPSFILAWAEAQDGIAAPADFNNPSNGKGEASTLTIANTTISGPDSSGYLTATAKAAGSFPTGAKMRTVALQGYYTQTSPSAARHTVSAVKTVTGDTARRQVFDSAKCANCHEFFEGHGGNRVFSKDTPATETSVCVMCHVPAKATSGRGISDTALNTYAAAGNFSTADLKKLGEWGLSTTFPVTVGSNWALKLPVTANNMKDMIHGIHAGRERVTPFKDARDRLSSAITLLDFRRMDFPGKLNNCETCHIAGTYASVPTGALASTYESIDATYKATANTTNAKAAYGQANPEDKVTSPFAAACVACHDSVAAQSHMSTQGGLIQVERGVTATPVAGTFTYSIATAGKGEACATCHGVGKAEDITVKHK